MSTEFPLRMVAAGEFDALRSYLGASGYSEEFLLEHFGAVSLHELLMARGTRQEAFEQLYQGDSLPLFLARLLMGGMAVTAEELNRYVPAPIQQTLRATGLLNDQLRCPVLVHSAFGLFVASDRIGYEGTDFVMSGAEGLCRQFLRYTGTAPCGRFLDMGTGAGIAAMLASSFAREVWAVDIVARAVRFAEWNCRLNGLTNVRVMQGDLFEPVRGIIFDRIVSNPPFEPSLTGSSIFACGGEDGEAILARLIAETPDYLAEGGRLYCQVEGTDRVGETLDHRMVRWLGSAAASCDTALFVRDRFEPMHFAMQQVVLSNEDATAVEQWAELYGRLQARGVIIGHMILQRHDGSRRSFHRRAQYYSEASIADLEACFDAEIAIALQGVHAVRPVPRAGWELHVRHRPHNGDLRPERYTFVTYSPLEGEWAVPAWLARVVSRCDGQITAEQHARWAETNAGVPEEEIYRGLGLLLWAGVLGSHGEEV